MIWRRWLGFVNSHMFRGEEDRLMPREELAYDDDVGKDSLPSPSDAVTPSGAGADGHAVLADPAMYKPSEELQLRHICNTGKSAKKPRPSRMRVCPAPPPRLRSGMPNALPLATPLTTPAAAELVRPPKTGLIIHLVSGRQSTGLTHG